MSAATITLTRVAMAVLIALGIFVFWPLLVIGAVGWIAFEGMKPATGRTRRRQERLQANRVPLIQRIPPSDR